MSPRPSPAMASGTFYETPSLATGTATLLNPCQSTPKLEIHVSPAIISPTSDLAYATSGHASDGIHVPNHMRKSYNIRLVILLTKFRQLHAPIPPVDYYVSN